MSTLNATGSSSSQNKAPKNSNMPPGMIMGPDGKPCKICTSFRNWKPRTTNHTESNTDREPKVWPAQNGSGANTQQKTNATAAATSLAGMAAFAGTATNTATASSSTTAAQDAPSYRGDEPPPGCPPDVEQLGRATWTFLHTTAAYYPEKPTPTQRANMLMLLRSIPVLYPCTWCANDFGENLEKSPPDVSGRTALSLWLCRRHNEVNEKLGKEAFDCAKVDERWKDGPKDGRCD